MASAKAGSRSFSGCSTGRPRASAVCFTAERRGAWPRPAGRSGWVTTAATWWPRSSRASSAGTAKGGVPMKTSLTRRASLAQVGLDVRGRVLRGRFLELPVLQELLHAALVEIALQAADAVDEELAVEMVDLVLQRHRKQALGLDPHFLLVRRVGAEQNARRAVDLGREVDDREAALFPDDRPLALDD